MEMQKNNQSGNFVSPNRVWNTNPAEHSLIAHTKQVLRKKKVPSWNAYNNVLPCIKLK